MYEVIDMTNLNHENKHYIFVDEHGETVAKLESTVSIEELFDMDEEDD